MTSAQVQHQINGWLQEVGSFQLDEAGVCVLADEERQLSVGLEIAGDGSAIFFQSPLCPVSLEDSELLTRALALNLYQQETAGGALALDTVTGDLVFCYTLHLVETTKSEEFLAILNAFVELAHRLRTALASESEESTANPESGEPDSGSTFIKI